jgi:transcriptional regulator with XRE-family HTH domain
MNFAKNIFALRENRGWTAQQLARRAGVEIQTVTRIEQGKVKSPSMTVFLKIASAFGVTADDMAGPLWKTLSLPDKPICREQCRNFGVNLRHHRKRLKLTQPALSAKSGITQSDISRLEKGKTYNPGCEIMERLARGLGIEVSDLLVDPQGLPQGLESFFSSPLASSASKADKEALVRVRLPVAMTDEAWYEILKIIREHG